MRLGLNLDGYEFEMFTSSDDPDELINYDIPDEVGAGLLFTSLPKTLIGYYGHVKSMANLTNLDLLAILNNIPNLKIVSQEPEIEAREIPDGTLT